MPQAITILGAGIAGLSASYHLGHARCEIFERQPMWGGHAGSEQMFGYTFDRGPHVSFTKHDYVRELFDRAVGGELFEFEVRTRNYFRGAWIDHPAQVHLWQIPQPLRDVCYHELLAVADHPAAASPANYDEWLRAAFGETFATTFPVAYTRKYWTVGPAELTCDWLGPRIHRPTRSEIEAAIRPGERQAVHYVSRVRYPQWGGYQSFMRELARGARLQGGREVVSIDLANRTLWFSDGARQRYERLVSTLPLDAFVNRCQGAPLAVREAAEQLACSQLLLVNVCAPHPARVDGHWFYVYDEALRATRVHLAERLSPHNAPPQHTAVQAEVYFSRQRPLVETPDQIALEVAGELAQMGFVEEHSLTTGAAQVSWRWADHANVIFSHARRTALDTIFRWLEPLGLARAADDLDPARDWANASREPVGHLAFAGRFAEWKYFWTDDCVLRGRQLAESLR